MTRKTLSESIRLFAGLSALALAASSCAPAPGGAANDPTAQVLELEGPAIDAAVEEEIAVRGLAAVHIRALPTAHGAFVKQAGTLEVDLRPEIQALLERLPEGSLTIEADVEGQPEVLGTLTSEGLAALRYDRSVEFIAKDRYDELIY